jgi:hypothetical protein
MRNVMENGFVPNPEGKVWESTLFQAITSICIFTNIKERDWGKKFARILCLFVLYIFRYC